MMNRASHWDENPNYPVADWKWEVANDETRQSYAEWAALKEEEATDNE